MTRSAAAGTVRTGHIIQLDQLTNDLGDLMGRFFKSVLDPGPDNVGRGAGIEFGLVTVVPHIQTPDLEQTMIQNRLCQQIEQSPLFNQRQMLPLGPKIGVDRFDMLTHALLRQGNRAVDVLKHGHAVLPDHILGQIEVAVEGGTANTGLFNDLGGGDVCQIFRFQQFKQRIGNIIGNFSLFHDTNVPSLFHFCFRPLHPVVKFVRIYRVECLNFAQFRRYICTISIHLPRENCKVNKAVKESGCRKTKGFARFV